MFIRALLLALVALLATSEAYKFWDGLTTMSTKNGAKVYYYLPENISSAKLQGWRDIGDKNLPQGLSLYCLPNDPRLGLLIYAGSGLVVGVQIAVLTADLAKQRLPLNYAANIGLFKKTLLGAEYWTVVAYFRREGNQEGERIQLHDRMGVHTIPTNAASVTSRTGFLKKRCINGIGGHYFRVSSTTKCDDVYPWFLLETQGVISGIGFHIIGKAIPAVSQNWYEYYSVAAVKATIPDLPACFTSLMNKYGSTIVHIWFVKNPGLITCPK